MSGQFSKESRDSEHKRKFSSGPRLALANLQKELTKLSTEKCCDKSRRCLNINFPGEDEGEFDYLEAKKCYLHYLIQYEYLSVGEWDIWIYDKFLHTCFGLDHGGYIIHSYRLSYGTAQDPKTVVVCRKVWMFFHHISDYEMKILSKSYKNNYSALGSAVGERQLYGDSTNHHSSIKELMQYYMACGIEHDSEPNMLKMGIVSRNQMDTFLWFRDHFETAGDPQPNGSQVHLDKIEKSDLYVLYVQEVQENCLTFSSWCKFWKNVFPEVTIRKWKNVSGKCEDCAMINNGRLVARSREEMLAFRRLHLLHKSGNFMLERLGYRERRNEAKKDKTVLSIIVDTMDNTHCYVPYFAGNDQLTAPLHQGILGCLEHGSSKLTVYRTTGTNSIIRIVAKTNVYF